MCSSVFIIFEIAFGKMESNKFKILVVDDEPDIVEIISYNLAKEGFKVYSASNGIQAIKKATKHLPHLILMDIMMPEMDGIQACEEIRQSEKLKQSIIIFLTARAEDYSQIAGFDAGGDDYITKPVKPKLLLKRIHARLKHYSSKGSEQSMIKIRDLAIDKEKYIVKQNNKTIVLPKKEFQLLVLLSSKPGRVFKRDEILDSIWGSEVIVGGRTIDVHIRKLREKLGDHLFKTIKGVGYKFISR